MFHTPVFSLSAPSDTSRRQESRPAEYRTQTPATWSDIGLMGNHSISRQSDKAILVRQWQMPVWWSLPD